MSMLRVTAVSYGYILVALGCIQPLLFLAQTESESQSFETCLIVRGSKYFLIRSGFRKSAVRTVERGKGDADERTSSSSASTSSSIVHSAPPLQ